MKILIQRIITCALAICICVIGYFGLSKIEEIIAIDNLTISIDPGHGGLDGGAIAKDGTYEKEIVLKVCFKIKAYFEAIGINVLMTRTDDYDLAPKDAILRKRLDILKRVELINNSNAIIFISIHANSYPSDLIKGAQTFYNKNNHLSCTLANYIQDSIKDILLNTDRTALGINEKYILDECKKPGVIVEIGFMSNDEELENLKSEIYQDYLAKAIYLGALNYIENC